MAHAVVVTVTIKDRAAATAGLAAQVIPNSQALAGFQSGYWAHSANDAGLSFQLFDTEANANAAAGKYREGIPAEAPVTIETVEVYEVRGQA